MRHEEDNLQQAVYRHLRLRAYPGVVFFHVPNGGRRNAREAGRLKSFGVLPGVSDLVLVQKGKAFFLELKAPKGRLSESQIIFQSAVNSAGCCASTAYGIDEALDILNRWGLIRPEAGAA
jgi:hypothetical protein